MGQGGVPDGGGSGTPDVKSRAAGSRQLQFGCKELLERVFCANFLYSSFFYERKAAGDAVTTPPPPARLQHFSLQPSTSILKLVLRGADPHGVMGVHLYTQKFWQEIFIYDLFKVHVLIVVFCNKHHVNSYKLVSNLLSNHHQHLDSLKTNYDRCFFTISYITLTPYYHPHMNYGSNDALFQAMTYCMIV